MQRYSRISALIIGLALLALGHVASSNSTGARAEFLVWDVPLPAAISVVDPMGNVWIASSGRRGSDEINRTVGYLEPCTGTFRSWNWPGVFNVFIDQIDEIATDGQGRLYWIGNQTYLARLDPYTDSLEGNTSVWYFDRAIIKFHGGLAVETSGDSVWLLSEGAVYRATFSSVATPTVLPAPPAVQLERWPTKPEAIALDEEGSLWLAGTNSTFRRSLARLDPNTCTLTEWEIPDDVLGFNVTRILQVTDEAVWAALEPGPLLIDQSTLVRLNPQTNELTTFSIPTFAVKELALNPQTLDTLWFTRPSRSPEILKLTLSEPQMFDVRTSTRELPLPPPLPVPTIQGEYLNLEEESRNVTASSLIVEANNLPFEDAERFIPDFYVNSLQFRGGDLFAGSSAQLAQIRTLEPGVESLGRLCATPLTQTVNVGETAVFTLTGGPPPICCDMALGLAVESIEPEAPDAEIAFEPFNFLGGFAGVAQTQLKVKIGTVGKYRITIAGMAPGGGVVKQGAQLVVK